MAFRTIAAIFIASTILTGCASTSPKQSRADDIAKIRKAKLETWPAIYDTMDAEWLDRFLLDSHVFIQDTGEIETKADALKWMRAYVPEPDESGGQPDDFVYTIKDIMFIAEDVVMVYGHGDSTRTNEAGEPCAHNYWSSNILKRIDGDWRPTFSHVSGVKCEVKGKGRTDYRTK